MLIVEILSKQFERMVLNSFLQCKGGELIARNSELKREYFSKW